MFLGESPPFPGQVLQEFNMRVFSLTLCGSWGGGPTGHPRQEEVWACPASGAVPWDCPKSTGWGVLRAE